MICNLLFYLVIMILFLLVAFGSFMYYVNRYPMTRCLSTEKLHGKTVIVTGASAGIGKEAAKDFARRGAKVILACRNKEKAQRIADNIIATTGNENVLVKIVDTSSLSSVRNFAKGINDTENRLDILVLNAGIVGTKEKQLTEDGLELTMATNHFGHFLMVNLLSKLLVKSKKSRIVVTSSTSHKFQADLDPKDLNFEENYRSSRAYSQSKICNVLMTKYLADFFREKGVTANCFCPGLVLTEIFDSPSAPANLLFWKFTGAIVGKSEEEGAQTLIYLAVSEEVANESGGFYTNCSEDKPNDLCMDAGIVKKVWEASEELVHLENEERIAL